MDDKDNMEEELEKYKTLVDELGVKTEIWKMHNWSGVQDISESKLRATHLAMTMPVPRSC